MAITGVVGDSSTLHARHRYWIRRAVLALRLVAWSFIRSGGFRSVPDISLLRLSRFH